MISAHWWDYLIIPELITAQQLSAPENALYIQSLHCTPKFLGWRQNFQTDTSVTHFVLTINTSVCPHIHFHIKWIQIQRRGRIPHLTLVQWELEEIRGRNYLFPDSSWSGIYHFQDKDPYTIKLTMALALSSSHLGHQAGEMLSVASAITRRRLCSPRHHYEIS